MTRKDETPGRRDGSPPHILFIMTDQQRFDTIAALGNPHIYTPNFDRLVRRGLAFDNGYSPTPVCVPARYIIRTGRELPVTRSFTNGPAAPLPGQCQEMEERCGPYLARTLRSAGYRTFGIGKFHTQPWDEDLGLDVHLHSEELYKTEDQRNRDDYAAWIREQRPEFDFIEGLMGERTEMYYMPQMSPMPADATVESWAADRAIEQIRAGGKKPYFGFVSFIGPHPPFAPPIPFNRLYDPDRMPNAHVGDLSVDHMDIELPRMNHSIWAEAIPAPHARILTARYYGEITYIDHCLGRILDAVDASGAGDNTLIAFMADHGDLLGDHGAWQKSSFYDSACRIPYLLSWPARLPAGQRRPELVSLTDLFGIATGAATGTAEVRDGIDVLGMVAGKVAPREHLLGMYGRPGNRGFKVMVRDARWKYIYLANGGREQLFDLQNDPHELKNLAMGEAAVARTLRARGVAACAVPGASDALVDGDFKAYPYVSVTELRRTYQFDKSRGINGFPKNPADALKEYERSRGGQTGPGRATP
jgi:arylsulfatase